jgi:hypothetical protein
VLLAKPQRANEVSLWYLRRLALGSQQIDRHERTLNEDLMIGRIALAASVALAPCVLTPGSAAAQDVPGIEICTVEKTMERRTSCLQSNVDFLQKTIAKLALDHQQKLEAANRQIEGLKATIVALQKSLDELQATQKKAAEDQKTKADAPVPKDAAK